MVRRSIGARHPLRQPPVCHPAGSRRDRAAGAADRGHRPRHAAAPLARRPDDRVRPRAIRRTTTRPRCARACWSDPTAGSAARFASPGAVATVRRRARLVARRPADSRSRRRSIRRGSSWAGSRRSTDADAGKAQPGRARPPTTRRSRGGSRAPTGAGTRRGISIAGRTCSSHDGPLAGPGAPGHGRRLGRQPTSRGTPTAGPSRSPPTAGRTPIPAPRHDDLGGRRRPADAGGGTAEPREVMAPGGWANHPAFSPDGRWLAAVGVLEPDPLDDISPGILLGPARRVAPTARPRPGSGPARSANWVDTDLNGWMVTGRSGPFWVDDRTLVATVSDRGRSHPRTFPHRSEDRPAGRSARPPRSPRTTSPRGRPARPTRSRSRATGVVAALGHARHARDGAR